MEEDRIKMAMIDGELCWLMACPPQIRVPVAVDIGETMSLLCGIVDGGMVGAFDDKIVTVIDDHNEDELIHAMKFYWAEGWGDKEHHFRDVVAA